jgi:hypothetical protein
MPLEFQSLSHGSIAFGFFNIETDMLLLEHYFLFAGDFCKYISDLTKEENELPGKAWTVYNIQRRADIGDLMGAIHGIRYLGFIGEVYRLFPFPLRPEEFKQKPEGDQTRSAVGEIVRRYATMISLPVMVNQTKDRVSIGEYLFSKATFHELITYVWRGGYPRWKNEVRPEYVLEMKKTLEQSEHALFKGLVLPLE